MCGLLNLLIENRRFNDNQCFEVSNSTYRSFPKNEVNNYTILKRPDSIALFNFRKLHIRKKNNEEEREIKILSVFSFFYFYFLLL